MKAEMTFEQAMERLEEIVAILVKVRWTIRSNCLKKEQN